MTFSLRIGLAILVVVSLAANPVAAQGYPSASPDTTQGKAAGTAAQPRFDARTGARLNQAIEQLNAGKAAQARDTLKGINIDRCSPYEVSRVEQLLASIDHGEGKYDSARGHLTKALDSGGLNDKEISTTRFQVAALYLAEERWAEGVKALEAWFAVEPNPNALGYYTLALAHYQLGNAQAAVGPAQKAIDLAGGKPQESWLQLLLALRAQRGEYSLAFPIVLQLLERAPEKKSYWIQGASIALATEKYDTASALLQLAHTGKFLTEGSEVQQLVDVLMYTGNPYRAGRILSEAMARKQVAESTKTYELLGNCWIAARAYDKAVTPLGRVGDLANSGEPYVRLAEVYFQQGDWSEAASVLERALGKGNLKRPGKAQLLMGVSLFNMKKVRDSRPWFERARTHSETQAQAEEWLRDAERELGS